MFSISRHTKMVRENSFSYISLPWHYSAIVFNLWALKILLFFCFSLLSVESLSASSVLPPEKHIAEGLNFFKQGAFDQAILNWQEAAKIYEKAENPKKRTEVLTLLS